MVVALLQRRIEVGNKMGTRHGLKFTVRRIAKDKEVPVLVDENGARYQRLSIILKHTQM